MQRWELFWNRLYNFIPTTLEFLYDKKYGDKNIKNSAENFVGEALKEARKIFIKKSNLPLSVSIKVLRKLKNVKIIASFDERSMNNFTIDTFHNEIPQNEFSFYPNGKFKTFNYVELKNFGRKIITTPKNDVRRLITMKANYNSFVTTKMVDDFEYDMKGENLLCKLKFLKILCNFKFLNLVFPSRSLMSPLYSPTRPRFFNMATLFIRAIFVIDSGIKKYVAEVIYG